MLARGLYRFGLIASLGLTACSSKTQVPIEVGTREVAVVAYFKGGETQLQVFTSASGAIEVPADSDRPLFVYLGEEGDYVKPDGSSYTLAELEALTARWAEPEPGGEVGSCGRCLAPAHYPPQLIGPGDACGPPIAQPSFRFENQDGNLNCAAAEERPNCALATEEELGEIDQVRSEIYLAAPGACPCADASPVDLSTYSFDPIEPAPHAVPLNVFAGLSGGRVFGVGDFGAAIMAPGQAPQVYVPPASWGLTIRSAVMIGNDQVLVSGAEFGTGAVAQYGFLLFDASGPTLSAPQKKAGGEDVRALRMEILEPGESRPLYLVGSRYQTSIRPDLATCETDLNNCQRVELRGCPAPLNQTYMRDAAVAPNRAGVAVADRKLFTRAGANNAWDCQDLTFDTEDGTIEADELLVTTIAGNRAYVCFQTKEERCTARKPAVATATIGEDIGNFVVSYIGDPGVACREFLQSPNADGARLLLSGRRIVDFASDGTITESSLTDLVGEIDAYVGATPLADGRLLIRGRENRIEVYDGTNRSVLYGSAPTDDNPEVALAEGNGNFLVLSDDSARRVNISGEVTPLSTDDLFPNRDVITAARDPSGNVVVGGRTSEGPWLARLEESGGRFEIADELALPDELSGRHVRRIAAIGPGSFIVLLNGNTVLRLGPDGLTPVELNWDDPDTDGVEGAPGPPSGGCSTRTLADNLDRAHGHHGVGWVTGDGYIFRIVGHAGERFGTPDKTTIDQLRGSCPDEVTTVGRRLIDEGPFFTNKIRVSDLMSSDEPGRRHHFEEVDVPLYDQAPDFNTRTGLDLVADSRMDNRSTYGIITTDGYLFRPSYAPQHRRAPLAPRSIAQDPAGPILLVSPENRIVLLK